MKKQKILVYNQSEYFLPIQQNENEMDLVLDEIKTTKMYSIGKMYMIIEDPLTLVECIDQRKCIPFGLIYFAYEL